MGDENLQVIEITLTFDLLAMIARGLEKQHTVIAPRSSKELLNVWMTTLLLSHHCVDE
jgi:hypothetical protein